MSYDPKRNGNNDSRSLPDVFQRLGKSQSAPYPQHFSNKTWTNSYNNSQRPIDKRLNFINRSNSYHNHKNYYRNTSFPDYNKIPDSQKFSPSTTYFPQDQNNTQPVSSTIPPHPNQHSPVPQDDFSFVRNQPDPVPESHQSYISFVKDNPYPYDGHMTHPMIMPPHPPHSPVSAPHAPNNHYSSANNSSYNYVSSPISENNEQYQQEPNPSRDRLAKKIIVNKGETDGTRQVIVTSRDEKPRSRSPVYHRKRFYSENSDDDNSLEKKVRRSYQRCSKSSSHSVSPGHYDYSSDSEDSGSHRYRHGRRTRRSDLSRSKSPSYRRSLSPGASSDEEHAPFLRFKPDFYTPDYNKRPLPPQFRENKKQASSDDKRKQLRNYPPLGSSPTSTRVVKIFSETKNETPAGLANAPVPKTNTNKLPVSKATTPLVTKTPVINRKATATTNGTTTATVAKATNTSVNEVKNAVSATKQTPAKASNTSTPTVLAKTNTNPATTAKKVSAVENTTKHKAAIADGAIRTTGTITSPAKKPTSSKITIERKDIPNNESPTKSSPISTTPTRIAKASDAETQNENLTAVKTSTQNKDTSASNSNQTTTNNGNDPMISKNTITGNNVERMPEIKTESTNSEEFLKIEPALQESVETNLLPENDTNSITSTRPDNILKDTLQQHNNIKENQIIKNEPSISSDKNIPPTPQAHELDIDDRDDIVVDVIPPINRRPVTDSLTNSSNTNNSNATPMQVDAQFTTQNEQPRKHQDQQQLSTTNLATIIKDQERPMNETLSSTPVIPQLNLLIQKLQQQPEIPPDLANQLLALNNALGKHDATKKIELQDQIDLQQQKAPTPVITDVTSSPELTTGVISAKRKSSISPEESAAEIKKLKQDWKENWKVQFRDDGELQYVNIKTGEVRSSRPW